MSSRRRHRGQSAGDEGDDLSTYRQTGESRHQTFPTTFLVDSMTCRDRTAEFLSAVKSIQTRQVRLCSFLKRTVGFGRLIRGFL